MIWQFHLGLGTDERKLFQAAMDDWAAHANVRFVERSTQSSFVTFKTDDNIDTVSHSSSYGMAGGEQFVKLDPITRKDSKKKSSRHEIGHSLGFHHEHQRCDRDTFVKVSAKLKPERVGDFVKMCGNDVKPIGDYDFTSIMHYNSSPNATTDGSDALTGTNAANQALLDDKASRNKVSPGDAAGLAELHGGNAHVYQLSSNGQIEKTIHQYSWSNDWAIATPFLMDVRNFLFLLKTSDGTMHVNVINADGSIGSRIDNRTWSTGWTTAIKYTIGTVNYILLYKRGDGTVHYNNINPDGTIGPHQDETHESGYTSIRHYAVGLDNFVVLANADTGAWRVRRIKFDGKIGESIHAGTWSTGWTSVEPYSAGGKNFLFRVKAGNGVIKIVRIKDNGTLGSTDTYATNGTNGWTTAIPYEVSGSVYLLFLNGASGALRISRLRSDGTIGTTTDEREFGPGWTVGAVYHVGLGTYLVLIKS